MRKEEGADQHKHIYATAANNVVRRMPFEIFECVDPPPSRPLCRLAAEMYAYG
jgi:hypothetical protein